MSARSHVLFPLIIPFHALPLLKMQSDMQLTFFLLNMVIFTCRHLNTLPISMYHIANERKQISSQIYVTNVFAWYGINI